MDFLVSLLEQGLPYTTINTARSALSAIILPTDNVNIGSHPIVSRFMKGIFKNNPPAPRYRATGMLAQAFLICHRCQSQINLV